MAMKNNQTPVGKIVDERRCEDAEGAILFDATVSAQVDSAWFVPEYWRAQARLRVQAGGRGGVAVIDTPAGDGVLRHYHRGGMVAALMGDRYFWTGADQSRPFAEFRLLAEIARCGLPGPAPVAASYRRRGLFYTADLITQHIADAQTLGECLTAGTLDVALAGQVGALIGRFHRAGIWHADLNAHNVLVTSSELYLIDFDRGRLRVPNVVWQQANLQRLRRSLLKLGAASVDEDAFERSIWQAVRHGHADALTT